VNFKVIIAGGRDFNNKKLLFHKADLLLKEQIRKENKIIIVSGGANGADKLGEDYAEARGFYIKVYPANWDDITNKPLSEIRTRRDGTKYWSKAGPERNIQMAKYGDALIAFWDGKSKGTNHMINIAKGKGLAVRVINY
jgi:hypothetical protein